MANRIRELLDEQSYRPATFARKVGISQSTLAEILNGKRDFNNVGVSKIIAMAKGFGVTVEYLSGEPGAPKYPNDNDEEDQNSIEKPTEEEETLLDIYRNLSENGKARLLGYAEGLSDKEKKEVSDHPVSDVAIA